MSKSKRNRKSPPFSRLPHVVQECPDYIRLSGNAVKLLLELVRQFNGFNNGNLCPSITLMKPRGFKSRTTLRRAIVELIEAEMIVLTRQGGKNKASLYALTWLEIDECPGKQLELGPTGEPWRKFYRERQEGWKRKLKPLVQKLDKVSPDNGQVKYLKAV